MDVYLLEIKFENEEIMPWKGAYITLKKAKNSAHNLCKTNLKGYKDSKSKIQWNVVETRINDGRTVVESFLCGAGQAIENGIKKEPEFYFKIFRLEVQ